MTNLAAVEKYVKHDLRNALQRDLRRLKILKEADVECCAYHHLRKLLRADDSWRVFARKYSSRTGRYTDLVLFHRKKPAIAVEIKWGRGEISGKDRRSLRSARRNLRVRKTYFYSVLADGSGYEKIQKKGTGEKYRLFERVVDLGYKSQKKIEKWREERRAYRE